MSGTKPTEGTLYIKNGQVMNGSYLELSGHVVNYVDGKGEIADDYGNKDIGDKVYYNPVANTKVDVATDENCTGNCKIFYVLEDKGTDYASVSLIMDSNINSDGVTVKSDDMTNNVLVAWVLEDDYNTANTDGTSCEQEACNDEGPVTVLNHLNNTTSTWKNVSVSLPTGQQIANVVNNTTWTAGGNYTVSELPIWLYGYLHESEPSVSGVYGYWTSTPASNALYTDNYVWDVDYSGTLSNNYVNSEVDFGVRPVITVLKSKLQ